MKKRKNSNGILCSLISATKSSSNLTVRILKRIYHLLLILCRRRDSTSSSDLRDLSKLLFDHLQTRFNELYSSLLYPSCEINGDLSVSLEAFTLLLRCCFVLFDSLVNEQDAQLQYGRVILRVLRMITPVEPGHYNGEKSIKFRTVHFFDDCFCVSIPSSSFAFFLPILEVFADELLMNAATRKHLMLLDSNSVTGLLFSQNHSFASITCVLEILSSHFLIYFFLSKSPKSFISPPTQLALESALILLSNPLISSSPKPYLSHLISLTSDSIPNTQFTNSASHAYETSLNLYSSQIKSLLFQDQNLPFSSDNSFDPFLLPSSKHFLPLFTSKPKITDFSAVNAVRSSLQCLKNNLQVPNEKYISSFLLRIASKSSFNSDKGMNAVGEEDGLVLSSILKLIFSSILHFAKFGCLEKIRRRTRFSDSAQWVLSYRNEAVTRAEPPRGSEFKCLLLHFSSLLPLCCASKMQSLVDNCLRIVAVLCHVAVAEDGDLRGLQSLGSFDYNSAWKTAMNIRAKFAKVSSLVKDEEEEGGGPYKSCKGDAFLKCVIGNAAETLPDYEELAEFVECEADKDYASWLQDWERFRGWKRRKIKYWGTRKKRRLWNAKWGLDNVFNSR